ncbi:MAG: PilZ domain-containing protein [Candidatus Firestonebacteria bacterium]|nr:PilZ domain-containing protein [Candidatus Firestonebacteria bacterium]
MAEGEFQIERRESPRWKCSISVTYKISTDKKFGGLKNLFIKAKTGVCLDISAGGIELVSDEPVKLGDKITVDIYLSATDNRVKAFGVVRRVSEKIENNTKKYFIGMEYTDIITESDEFLEEIIEQKLQSGAGSKLSKEEALKLARHEYFHRLINEETFNLK